MISTWTVLALLMVHLVSMYGATLELGRKFKVVQIYAHVDTPMLIYRGHLLSVTTTTVSLLIVIGSI